MKVNPGGLLDPKDILGRDETIEQIWKRLESLSIVIAAERRVGKTNILKKMQKTPIEAFKSTPIIYIDLEAINFPLEFSKALLKEITPHLNKTGKFLKTYENIKTLLPRIKAKGLSIEASDNEWKNLLLSSMEILNKQYPNGTVLFFDEIPIMLLNFIEKEKGVSLAKEFLGLMRVIRQTYKNIRMVYTGSIGLHHIIKRIKEESGASFEPINDMISVEVEALTLNNAESLTKCLLIGEGLLKDRDKSLDQLTKIISLEVDCIPFYIHHVIAEMQKRNIKIEEQEIKVLIEDSIVNPDDIWHLTHYKDRIPTYYCGNENLVMNILDLLASDSKPTEIDNIKNKLDVLVDEEIKKSELLELLRALSRDHYLKIINKNEWCFKYTIAKRWWVNNRGLN